MAITEFVLDRANESDETLTLTKTGFSFSASFIKNKKLEQKKSVKVLKDDENPYWLGFIFLDEANAPNSLTLLNKQGNSGKVSASRSIKAGQLYSKSEVLSKLRDSDLKTSRRFQLQFDLTKRHYFIELRPAFERKVPFQEKHTIPPTAKGIYRYRNNDNEIVYIGKGVIKDRAHEPDRQNWQITQIEYSICKTDEEAFRWEAYYIEEYESLRGKIPLFNQIKGQSKV